MVEEADKIWMDGKMVDWKDANVHVLSHALHYGTAVFEGIRCYRTEKGSAVFRLKEHVDRLFDSAHIFRMKIPYSKKEFTDAIIETIKVNKLEECYVRPIAYLGYGPMGLNPVDSPVKTSIAAWKWGAYLGDDGITKGVRVKTSSFTRHHVNVGMVKAKISGNYANSVLSKHEAVAQGYDEAIMLDTEGYVAECTGENIFVVKDGVIKTPSQTSLLGGITRDAIIHVARDLGFDVKEEKFTRDELWISDEVFLTGTAAEVTPIREADDRAIADGKPGPVTKYLQKKFSEIVSGKDDSYKEWLHLIS